MLEKRLLAAGIVAGLAVGLYGVTTTVVLAAGPPPQQHIQPPKPPTCRYGYVANLLIDPRTGKTVWKCVPKT